MARAGKDVILVDADLRRPRVTQRLHLEQTAGLGAVLINEVELEAALVERRPKKSVGTGRLRVLPSGDPPPNPSALLASQRMKSLVEQLTTMSDLVIIDSTPLLVVSDSLPLVEFVSGVVAVARLNQTTKDAMSRFERVIVNAGGTLLGTVASGADRERCLRVRIRRLRGERRPAGRRLAAAAATRSLRPQSARRRTAKEDRSEEEHRAHHARGAMRVLVTGGAGFIGSNLVDALLSDGPRRPDPRQLLDRPSLEPPPRSTATSIWSRATYAPTSG